MEINMPGSLDRGDYEIRSVIEAWAGPGATTQARHVAAQERLRREWPTLAIALDRLAASSTAGGDHLSAGQLYAISARNRDRGRRGPWGTPPASWGPGPV